jgi:transcriptional regulator with GAF, ATPase, and Fis domain/tetratricopeptide (TPR) repeat protein
MAPPRFNALLSDRYRVVRPLGTGSEGSVYLVADTGADDALRALKIVRGVDPAAHARLAGEFQRLAALDHPALVPVFDLDTAADGAPFFTSEYIDGQPPAAWLGSRDANRVESLLDLAGDIASALAHVHAAGLCHSDVKPDNMLVRAGSAGGGRAVLLDLGLATARAIDGGWGARGSLAYMSREALSGRAEPRSDLYALGASLYEIATGRAPFSGDDASQLVRAICEDALVPVRTLAPWVPEPVAGLIEKLLSRDAAARHSSASVLLDDLARVRERLGLSARDDGERPAPTLLPPALVGRDHAITALLDVLRRVSAPEDAGPAPRVVELVGAAGSGRSAALDEAVRRHQLAAATGRARPVALYRGDVDRVLRAIRGELGAGAAMPEAAAGTQGDAALAQWVDGAVALLARRAGAGPFAIALAGDVADPRARALADALLAGAGAAGACAIIFVAGEAEPDHGGARDRDVARIPIPPLSPADVRRLAASMLGRDPGDRWASALAESTGGIPRLIVEVVRAAAADAGVEGAASTSPRGILAGAGDQALAELIVRRVSALDASRAAVLEALAVLGGRATGERVAATTGDDVIATYAAIAHLAARGFVTVDGDDVRLPSPVHQSAIEDALPEARAKALHRAALKSLGDGGDPVERARHLAVTGPARAAADACVDAAHALERAGRVDAAVDHLLRATATATGTVLAEINAELAERAASVGRYDVAVEAAEAAARTRDPDRRRRATLALARAQQKRGDLAAAERVLEQLVAGSPDDERATGSYARLLVSRARYAEAAQIAGAPERDAPVDGALPDGRALRLEAAGLARLYLNDTSGADAAFARLDAGAKASGDRALRGRALALRGMVAQTRGDIPRAADLYAAAHVEARAASDVHAAAVYALNRATALSVRGRHGDAVRAIDEAIAQLRRLGDVAEIAAALFNRGVSLLALGEVASARRAAESARAEAEARGTPEMQIFALLLSGDVARREGALPRARDDYERALSLAVERGQPRALLLARLSLAEVLAELGDGRAVDVLAEAGGDALADDDRDQIGVARARLALAGHGDAADAADRLDAARAHLRSAGRIDLAWRADVLAARLAWARGDLSAATQALASARASFQELLSAAPESHRDGIRTDPDAVSLATAGAELDSVQRPVVGTESQPMSGAESRLRRLLALSRRLNSELRLEPLLDDVIDTLIELTAAERGFLLLSRDGELHIEVARNFEHTSLASDELQVSRSIAERAASTGEVVLTVDAAFDERFGAAASVAALKLRSVLAVPLRQKGRVTGTIYLDHRFRRGAFSDEAVDLVLELADVAAVAIENARLVDENRRRQDEIAELNRRLEDEVVEKEAELATVKARLSARGETELRHPYDAIVGRSPAMLEMLQLLDRATDTALPVVISGESGTGKELVARALHNNGPRRDRPFVALNCGAVPAELLESELFGHVRGAFTGADRDRRGLFEVASGGALFLDEVADTSLAMQAKLLRVLQEGEIRRVGDEQLRKVDVRIIAASNRELRGMVDEGVFREDLYYRLAVLHIRVPALRERVEDVPELAGALLARFGEHRDTPQRIDATAMSRLCAYPWPGNVRELENELARASALAGEVIGADDLSRAIATTDLSRRPLSPNDLRMRPRVEALERALVEDAMERANGNQTAAAKLLGLSRYGLQKKLKRYGISQRGHALGS